MNRWLFLLAGVLVLTACENTVEPVVEDAEFRYAVYGFLDMRTDRQIIRVEALRPTILADEDGLDGVQVVIVEEGTGNRTVFRDSTGTASDGSPVSLFVAPFTPEAGRTYRLEVARPGELPTVATTHIPADPVLQFEPPTGTAENLSQVLYLSQINGAPEAVTIHYTVVPPNQEGVITIPVSYGRLSTSPVSELNFRVNYYADRYVVMNALGLQADEPGVRLVGIALSLDLPSPEWRQVQPLNINRGHGFFASVGQHRFAWKLDRTSVETLGWIDVQVGE